MDFTNVISERYSCKKFGPGKISEDQLNAILAAGRLAPTAKNNQEHHVYVAQSDEALAKIDEITPCRYGAQTVLVVTYREKDAFVYPGEKRNSGAEDASIVATHLMLAATNAGVDNCWINFFNPDTAKAKLELPENEEVLMLLDLGFAAEGTGPLANHGRRKDISETVSFI